MSETVVVLGAGYAGTGAIRRLERVLDAADLVRVSDTDYHFVRHESHRVVGSPASRSPARWPRSGTTVAPPSRSRW